MVSGDKNWWLCRIIHTSQSVELPRVVSNDVSEHFENVRQSRVEWHKSSILFHVPPPLSSQGIKVIVSKIVKK